MEYKMERISFDGDFELIQKTCGGLLFDYPVIHIPGNGGPISFNKFARDLFPENTHQMFIVAFMDYIAILPDDYKTAGKNLFAYHRKNGTIAYPVALKGKKIPAGYYRLYQYRDGIAFNRYERMDKNGNLIAA